MKDKLEFMADLLGPENVFTDYAVRLANAQSFGKHADVVPFVCVRPKRNDQVGKLLRYCSEEKLQVTFRGGGTSFRYPVGPRRPETVMILTSGLDRIYEVDERNMQAHVQPGVTYAQLTRAVGKKGLFFPVGPWLSDIGTIGANIAINAPGRGYLRYGSVANFVNRVDLWLADGSCLPCFSANLRLPGFPLGGLCCGSAGCFGFLGDCYLRLLHRPTIHKWIFAWCETGGQATNIYQAILPLEPVSAELYDACCASVLIKKEAKRLLLAVEINCECQNQVEVLTDTVQKGGGILFDFPEYEHARAGLLAGLYALNPALSLESLFVPADKMDEIIEILEEMAREGEGAFFGLCGTGQWYLALTGDRKEKISRVLLGMERMANGESVKEGEEEISRKEWENMTSELATVSQSFKKLLDPAGILADKPLPGRYEN